MVAGEEATWALPGQALLCKEGVFWGVRLCGGIFSMPLTPEEGRMLQKFAEDFWREAETAAQKKTTLEDCVDDCLNSDLFQKAINQSARSVANKKQDDIKEWDGKEIL